MSLSIQTSKARRWLASLTMLALLGTAVVAPNAASAADEPTDMVLQWNAHAIRAIGNPATAAIPGLGQPPPLAPIHLAMVHGAIYDAVIAIQGGYEPYLAGLSAPGTASKAAAVATAARDVLVALPPGSTAVTASVNESYRVSLLAIDDGPAKDAGIAVGRAAAAAMLAARTGDGRFGSLTWTVGTEVGQWRPLPPQNASVFAWIARVEPFTLKSSDQFRTEGPLDLGSAEYAAEFNEVKRLGSNAVPSARSEAQTQLAHFVSANPFPILNGLLRSVAVSRHLSTTDQARLFVQSSMSAADAAIGCWDDKYHWNFWRPQTAIRLAADDGNPATVADPNWLPMFPNPGYPDHPSGYNCLTASMMHTASAFFGTDKIGAFSLTSPGTNPPTTTTTRNYTRFSRVVKDAIDGRILTGFHFRTPDVQGAWLGKKVAQWVDKHYFEPVD